MINANTIIVIDDDLDDLDIMSDVIATVDPSVNCLTFKDPVEAVNELLSISGSPPRYIFIDHNMPIMRGDEVLKKLRADDRFQESIIVLISTSMPMTTSSLLYEGGANYAVEKPNRLANYYTLLKSIFRNHR
ncbi:response regulator [Chryseolinea sp. T2]|uniref:response regulator n=1 Tax=Chryseolinea sp. T2 TaxID=3129255 RepID=UPI0030784430